MTIRVAMLTSDNRELTADNTVYTDGTYRYGPKYSETICNSFEELVQGLLDSAPADRKARVRSVTEHKAHGIRNIRLKYVS